MDVDAYTDFSITGLIYLTKYTGLWWTQNKAEERQRMISVLYMTIGLVYGVYVNIIDGYHRWGDTNYCLFLLLNMSCTCTAIVKMLIMTTKRAEFGSVILHAQQHFWHRNYSLEEQIMFSSCAKHCTWFVKFMFGVVPVTLSGYFITPIVANHGRNMTERMLPSKLWAGTPLTETPYYELMFIFEGLWLFVVGAAYLSTDLFLCLLGLHVVCQFRILQYRLLNFWKIENKKLDANAYADHCYASLKKCIQYHQMLITFCNRLENMYTMLILTHMAVLSMLLSVDCYQLAVADGNSTMRQTFLCHFVGSVAHLFMLTYTSHCMMDTSMDVTAGVYFGFWNTLPMNKDGKSFRTAIKFIMMRSLKPCCLTAGGFFPVTLEAFSKILSTAFSYFTLMRQSFTRAEDN